MSVATSSNRAEGAKAHLKSDIFQRSAASCSMTFYYNMNSASGQVCPIFFITLTIGFCRSFVFSIGIPCLIDFCFKSIILHKIVVVDRLILYKVDFEVITI